MHTRTRELLRAFLREYEGNQRVMYLDEDGYVTTGVGFLINSVQEAQGLPWFNRETHTQATQEEITSEWRRIHDGGDSGTSPLRLGQTAIDAQMEQLIDQREQMLRSCFPGFNSIPADAQLGMLVHSWLASSCIRIRTGYPDYYAACTARNWNRAGYESLWARLREALRRGGPERRVNRARAMLRMFRNASIIEAARRQRLSTPDWPFYPRSADISYSQMVNSRSREATLQRRHPGLSPPIGSGTSANPEQTGPPRGPEGL